MHFNPALKVRFAKNQIR